MDSIIVFCAKYLFVAVILIAAWIWLKSSSDKKIRLAVAAISAGVIALILAKIAGKLYYDPRPFAKSSVKPLFTHAADNGFPSDHSWFTMTAAALLFYYDRQLAWLALAASVIVGVARVLAHVHSPIDIAGGFAIGIVAALAGQFLAKKILSSPPAGKKAPEQN